MYGSLVSFSNGFFSQGKWGSGYLFLTDSFLIQLKGIQKILASLSILKLISAHVNTHTYMN